MNGDLISRSALLQEAYEDYRYRATLEDWELNLLQNYLDAAPAVDAVEVVRCKDCKFRCETDDGEYNPEDIVCTYWETDGLKACDFCSYGERRADDGA